MLLRVAVSRVPTLEVPVGRRRRLGGISKVSGNFLVSIKAGFSITAMFIRLALLLRWEQRK